MLEKIRAYIKENRMLERKDKIVIGVSGGADSVCLFFVLLELCKEYELSLQVMHVNHGIRGAEADMDEAFVRSLAEEKGVNFEAFHADIPAMAKEKGLGEEEMGRLYRYEVLEKVRKSSGADRIAVAHNENDCAETVLLNLFRGSGVMRIQETGFGCIFCRWLSRRLTKRQLSIQQGLRHFCERWRLIWKSKL